jgi:hypothetical protein
MMRELAFLLGILAAADASADDWPTPATGGEARFSGGILVSSCSGWMILKCLGTC